MIFSRGRDRDEGCTGFSVGGETETRVALDLGDGGEIEGPKNAISTPRVSKIETLDVEVFTTDCHQHTERYKPLIQVNLANLSFDNIAHKYVW